MTRQGPDKRALPGGSALPLLLGVLALSSGCAYILGGTVDYVFAVAGTVTAPDGTPIEGCAVTLEVGSGVYQGIEPIRRQSKTTNIYGGFQFTYITHRHNMPYQLRFEKGGYVVYTVVGASPPRSTHNVTLQPAPASALYQHGKQVPGGARGVAEQRDAADEGRLDTYGSMVVGNEAIVNGGEVVRPSQLITSVRRLLVR